MEQHLSPEAQYLMAESLYNQNCLMAMFDLVVVEIWVDEAMGSCQSEYHSIATGIHYSEEGSNLCIICPVQIPLSRVLSMKSNICIFDSLFVPFLHSIVSTTPPASDAFIYLSTNHDTAVNTGDAV